MKWLDAVREASDPLRPLDRRLLDDPVFGSIDSGWLKCVGVAAAKVDGDVCGESMDGMRRGNLAEGRLGGGLRSVPADTCFPSAPSPPPPGETRLYQFQMGWFGSSTQEPTAVSREGRKLCWENRDAYFKCLDNASVLKPGDEGKACSSEKVAYEKNCAKSWVRCASRVLLWQPRIEMVLIDRVLQQTTGVGRTAEGRSTADEESIQLFVIHHP